MNDPRVAVFPGLPPGFDPSNPADGWDPGAGPRPLIPILIHHASGSPVAEPDLVFQWDPVGFPQVAGIPPSGVRSVIKDSREFWESDHWGEGFEEWQEIFRKNDDVSAVYAIEIAAVIVVVEWDWRHLNPSRPYNPDINDTAPGWIIEGPPTQ